MATMVVRSVLALLCLALAACSDPAPHGDPPAPPPRPAAVAPITTELAQVRGWGPLTLGMTIDEARAALARLALPVTESSAPASKSVTLTFEVEGDEGSAWFTRGVLLGVALYRRYEREADAFERVAAFESAWGDGFKRVTEGRNQGHEATHYEWRTDAIVVSAVVHLPGTGHWINYSEDYRAP